eukprot:1487972-Amphidinium_carterae.1
MQLLQTKVATLGRQSWPHEIRWIVGHQSRLTMQSVSATCTIPRARAQHRKCTDCASHGLLHNP